MESSRISWPIQQVIIEEREDTEPGILVDEKQVWDCLYL